MVDVGARREVPLGYASKPAKFRLVLIKIMLENLCTNPIGTSSKKYGTSNKNEVPYFVYWNKKNENMAYIILLSVQQQPILRIQRY